MRILTGLLVCVAASFAQTPEFEAATIKPSPAAPGSTSWHTRTGRMVIDNMTLKQLITTAYNVKEFQVTGGPKWADNERWNVNAKAEDGVKDTALLTMLQALLKERFQLQLHKEGKEAPGYALQVAKGGPKLEKGDLSAGSSSKGSRGSLDVKNATMAKLTEQLARIFGMPVVDQTGLEGAYTFKLEWAPETMMPNKPGMEGAADAPSGPSIFSALQQQLGLKLESHKTPVDVYVIDRAEKPTEN